MRRGTTPVIVLKLKNYDIENIAKPHITLRQKSRVLVKDEYSIELNRDDNSFSVGLTQDETLMFEVGEVKVQLKAMTTGGEVIASNIHTYIWEEILEEGVMTNG